MRICGNCKTLHRTRDTVCRRCAAELTANNTEVLIDGRYFLERELGRGGMGVVWCAMDLSLRRRVALKLLSEENAATSSGLDRFLNEAAVLASIRHEHVAQVYGLGEHENGFYFAMEFVSGRDLYRILVAHRKEGLRVPIHRSLTIVRQVSSGLAAVHAAGLVHRDVKPENILIEEATGRPVLADFGLALAPDVPREANTTRIVGSPAYIAPEQVRPRGAVEVVSPFGDQYSLACTVFELLTGRLPFDGESVQSVLLKHAFAPAPVISSLDPALKPFDEVLLRAMAKKPEERFESVLAFAAALDAAGVHAGCADELPATQSTVPSIAQPTGEAVHVIVVDDDPVFRTISRRAVEVALKGTSARVTPAGSGEEALRIAAQRPPHLVLLDYSMPGLDGLETLSRLRNLRGGRDARVMVISANVGEAERWRFSVLGVEHLLLKPVSFQKLVEELRKLAARRGLLPPELTTTIAE